MSFRDQKVVRWLSIRRTVSSTETADFSSRGAGAFSAAAVIPPVASRTAERVRRSEVMSASKATNRVVYRQDAGGGAVFQRPDLGRIFVPEGQIGTFWDIHRSPGGSGRNSPTRQVLRMST